MAEFRSRKPGAWDDISWGEIGLPVKPQDSPELEVPKEETEPTIVLEALPASTEPTKPVVRWD